MTQNSGRNINIITLILVIICYTTIAGVSCPLIHRSFRDNSFTGDIFFPSRAVAVIPTCNRFNSTMGNSLNDAIESVLAQTRPVEEIVVAIDSGPQCVSTIENKWGNIVTIVKLPRCVRGVNKPKNHCGLAGRARQYGMEHARTEKVTHWAFLDDDDAWLPKKMDTQLKAMQRDQVELISGDAFYPLERNMRCAVSGSWRPWNFSDISTPDPGFIPWNTGKYKTVLENKFRGPLPSHLGPCDIGIRNIFVTSATVVSQRAIRSGFDVTLPNGREDYSLWKDIISRVGRATWLHEPLVIYDTEHACSHITSK